MRNTIRFGVNLCHRLFFSKQFLHDFDLKRGYLVFSHHVFSLYAYRVYFCLSIMFISAEALIAPSHHHFIAGVLLGILAVLFFILLLLTLKKVNGTIFNRLTGAIIIVIIGGAIAFLGLNILASMWH